MKMNAPRRRARLIAAALTAILVVIGAGCDNEHTPWTDGDWPERRSRDNDIAQSLDHRLRHTQDDR